MSIILIFLILAAISFGLGAANVAASINWDQAGKCLLVIAAIVHLTGH